MNSKLSPSSFSYNNILEILDANIYVFLRSDSQHTLTEYINEHYCASRLGSISKELANIINASVVNVSKYDFTPYGSSTNTLISIPTNDVVTQVDDCIIAHLDKSHISIHTYIDFYDHQTSLLRFDITVSTCGVDSPLNTMKFLFDKFQPQVAFFEYRLRGFNLKNKNAIKDKESIKNFKSHALFEKSLNTYEESINEKAHLYQLKYMQNTHNSEQSLTRGHKVSGEGLSDLTYVMKQIYNSIHLV